MGDVFEFAIPCHPFNPQIRDLLSLRQSRPVSVTNPDRGHILLPSPAAGEEPAPGANGKIARSAPERPTSPGLVQQAGLEPLPASPSRLSVRRQNESPRSMHGDGPYCYLNNPGFEPCRIPSPALDVTPAKPLTSGYPSTTDGAVPDSSECRKVRRRSPVGAPGRRSDGPYCGTHPLQVTQMRTNSRALTDFSVSV